VLKTPLDTINPSFKPSCPVENIPKNVLIERNNPVKPPAENYGSLYLNRYKQYLDNPSG
jgi:hypothetical protein